ncbi:hypothetical protein BDV36DRAFT_253576, partial [Aspergillus pseudocaelatus]
MGTCTGPRWCLFTVSCMREKLKGKGAKKEKGNDGPRNELSGDRSDRSMNWRLSTESCNDTRLPRLPSNTFHLSDLLILFLIAVGSSSSSLAKQQTRGLSLAKIYPRSHGDERPEVAQP